jgi:hypothetical protein
MVGQAISIHTDLKEQQHNTIFCGKIELFSFCPISRKIEVKLIDFLSLCMTKLTRHLYLVYLLKGLSYEIDFENVDEN